MEMDKQLEETYIKYLSFTDKLVLDYHPLALAATMMTIALQLYKTSLTEEGYNEMIDSISNMRNDVKKLDFGRVEEITQ